MTDLTKKNSKKFPKIKNIIQINNPIIDENLFKSSNILLDSDLKKIFENYKIIISIGRLTKQKNFLSY